MTGFWDGSGISWTICKQSAPRSRQITTPTPHQSIFTGRMLFRTRSQQRQSTEGTHQCNQQRQTVKCSTTTTQLPFYRCCSTSTRGRGRSSARPALIGRDTCQCPRTNCSRRRPPPTPFRLQNCHTATTTTTTLHGPACISRHLHHRFTAITPVSFTVHDDLIKHQRIIWGPAHLSHRPDALPDTCPTPTNSVKQLKA